VDKEELAPSERIAGKGHDVQFVGFARTIHL
jgi:hypothetical protein